MLCIFESTLYSIHGAGLRSHAPIRSHGRAWLEEVLNIAQHLYQPETRVALTISQHHTRRSQSALVLIWSPCPAKVARYISSWLGLPYPWYIVLRWTVRRYPMQLSTATPTITTGIITPTRICWWLYTYAITPKLISICIASRWGTFKTSEYRMHILLAAMWGIRPSCPWYSTSTCHLGRGPYHRKARSS